MKNIIIMCRQEGTSRVKSINDFDTEVAVHSLSDDINRVSRLLSSKYCIYVCNLFAWEYNVITTYYTKYLDENIKPVSMNDLNSLLPECEGVVLLGMTAKAGTIGAFAAGSYNHLGWHNYYINNQAMGELGIYKTFFDSKNVPVIAVCGDRACCEEAKQLFGEIGLIETKWAKFRNLAICYTDEVIEKNFEKGIKTAVALPKSEGNPISFPLEIVIEYNRTDFCDDAFERGNNPSARLDARTLFKRVEKIENINELLI